MGNKKKYVLVGSGGRAEFFYSAIATTFRETSELLAFCDTKQTRMNYANRQLTERYGNRTSTPAARKHRKAR